LLRGQSREGQEAPIADRPVDSERIGNAQLIVNELPVLQVL
jgi:hypothetical protein